MIAIRLLGDLVYLPLVPRCLFSVSTVACLGLCVSAPALGQEQSEAQEQQASPKSEPASSSEPKADTQGRFESEAPRSLPQNKPTSPRVRPAPQKQNGKQLRKSDQEAKKDSTSPWFPDWQPNKFSVDLQPVLGLGYLNYPETKTSIFQSELGAYLGVRGWSIVPGNPGLQLEPGAGYAFGYAVVNQQDKNSENGSYRRAWGSVRTPIYYRFVRQVFAGQYGEVRGGPLPVSKRAVFQSDTGVAIINYVSGHYTLTYDRAYGEDSDAPEIRSYDHWVHGRFSAPILNFFIDVGPGFSVSTFESKSAQASFRGESSGAYLLGLSGMDLFTDKIGLDASAKYIFSSKTDVTAYPSAGRSPLEDLGAQPILVGQPADSLHASAFFGLRRLIGGIGIGWRYNLEILNFSEANNTKQSKRETFGFGVNASYKL